jgi:hypothetical protein
MIKATGTWILCKDPRPKVNTDSDIILLDSTVKSMNKDERRLETNILEVLSVGPLVRDENLKNLEPGRFVSADTRAGIGIVPMDIKETESVLVIQENQVMFILE